MYTLFYEKKYTEDIKYALQFIQENLFKYYYFKPEFELEENYNKENIALNIKYHNRIVGRDQQCQETNKVVELVSAYIKGYLLKGENNG